MREEILVDYLEGRLSAKKRAKVERHLSECDGCFTELMLDGEMMQAEQDLSGFESAPDHLTKKTIEKINRLIDDTAFERISKLVKTILTRGPVALRTLFPSRKVGLAPVRGTKTVIDENLILLKKSFVELDIEIEMDKVMSGKVSIKVMLANDFEAGKPVRATMLKNGREVSSYLMKSTKALFENMHFGHYTLVLSINGAEKGRYSFEIKESPNGRQ